MIEQALFTIPLFSKKIDSAPEIKKTLFKGLLNFERASLNDNVRHIKVWQTPNNLHINPQFEFVVDSISDMMPYIKDRFKLSYTETTAIDNMYGLSINTDGKMLSTYQTNNFMHGVYFVDVPKKIKINFNNIVPDRNYFPSIFSEEANDVNSDWYSISAEEGMLMMCPSFVSIETDINFASKPVRLIYFTIRTQVQ